MLEQAQSLPYTIVNQQDYFHQYSNGNISNIKEKRGDKFVFSHAMENFTLSIRLNQPANAKTIKLHTARVAMVEVECTFRGGIVFDRRRKLTPEQMDGKCGYSFQFQTEAMTIIDKVQIKLMNFPGKNQSQIYHILVLGKDAQISNNSSPKKKQIPRGQPTQVPSTHQKPKKQQMDIFQSRQKNKVIEEKKVEVIEIVDQEEKRQIQKAIKASLSASQIKVNYQLMPYKSNFKKIIDDVNPEWLLKQKQMQQKMGINQEHRLSSQRPPIKSFVGLTFCINNIYSSVRTQLEEKIAKLGGVLISQPSDNCIILTNRLQGAKINLSKFMKNISYLSPAYVDQCFFTGTKLPFNDFQLK